MEEFFFQILHFNRFPRPISIGRSRGKFIGRKIIILAVQAFLGSTFHVETAFLVLGIAQDLPRGNVVFKSSSTRSFDAFRRDDIVHHRRFHPAIANKPTGHRHRFASKSRFDQINVNDGIHNRAVKIKIANCSSC